MFFFWELSKKFTVLPFCFPATLILRPQVWKMRRTSRGKCPPPDSDPLERRSVSKNLASLSSLIYEKLGNNRRQNSVRPVDRGAVSLRLIQLVACFSPRTRTAITERDSSSGSTKS